MKLELKHLAPYLPYNLKFVYQENTVNEYYTLSVTHTGLNKITVNQALDFETFKAKPILRPLSGLYIHKLKNGKTLPEWWKEQDSFSNWFLEHDDIELENIATVQAKIWISLIQQHYDVFGLIEKGLAININVPVMK
jgi:hypothetical protein